MTSIFLSLSLSTQEWKSVGRSLSLHPNLSTLTQIKHPQTRDPVDNVELFEDNGWQLHSISEDYAACRVS